MQEKTEHEKSIPPAGETSVWQDLRALLLKITVVALIFALMFTFLYGLLRYASADMRPAVQDGDLVLFYRLGTSPVAGEVIVYDANGKTQLGRVVAVAGDTVDIDGDGLIINGSHQQEMGIYTETTQFTDGISFPVTVPDGAVFVLGDNRPAASDSRMLGCIRREEIRGKVIGFLRRREI